MKKNHHFLFWMSLSYALGLGIVALTAPWISPFDPNALLNGFEKRPPSWTHFFGTDELGKDIFSRVLYGARVSLCVGLSATLLSFILGTLVGMAGGFFRGKVDLFLQFVTDLTLSFPTLLLAMGITVVLRPGVFSITLSLALVGWAPFARLARSAVLELRERPFVEAARSLGRSSGAILQEHFLPNLAPVLVVAIPMKMGGFILNEAALSFLGLGPDPSTPSWGSMIHLGLDFIRYEPWIAFFPGLALFLCVAAFNIMAERLQYE